MPRIYSGFQQQKTRSNNLGMTLQILRNEKDITRRKIAEYTALTKTTVSDLLNELFRLKIAQEHDQKKSTGVGRKSQLITLVPNSILAIGISIRKTATTGILVDPYGKVLAKRSLSISGTEFTEKFRDVVLRLIDELRTSAPSSSLLVGVGIGQPASMGLFEIDDTGMNKPVASGVAELIDTIKMSCSVPVMAEIGAAAAAFGEFYYRMPANPHLKEIVFVSLDLGIGFGHVVNGEIVQGTRHGGFLGHTVVQADGLPCYCGRHGCLYQYASGFALLRAAGIVEGSGILDPSLDYNSLLTKLHESATEDEERFEAVVEHASEYMLLGLINIFNLINPDLLVLGGDDRRLSNWYFDAISKKTHDSPPIVGPILDRIQRPLNETSSIATGAAAMVLDAFLQDPVPLLINREKNYE